MLEKVVANFLTAYLGEYIENIDKEQIKVSVWKGNVHLRKLRIRRDALRHMDTTLCVTAGVIEELTVRVPWTKLQSESVEVTMRNVNVVLGQKASVGYDAEQNREEALERKRRHLVAAEKALFEEWAAARAPGSSVATTATQDEGNQANDTFSARLWASVVNNVKLKIDGVRVQFISVGSSPVSAVAGGGGGGGAVTFEMDELSTFACNASYEPAFSEATLKLLHKRLLIRGMRVSITTFSRLSSSSSSSFSTPQGQQKPPLDAQKQRGQEKRLLGPASASMQLQYQPIPYDKHIPTCVCAVRLDPLLATLSESTVDTLVAMGRQAQRDSATERAQLRRPLSLSKRPSEDPRAWWKYTIGAVLENLRRQGAGTLDGTAATGRSVGAAFDWVAYKEMKQKRSTYLRLYTRSRQDALSVAAFGGPIPAGLQEEPLIPAEETQLAYLEADLSVDVVCLVRRAALESFAARRAMYNDLRAQKKREKEESDRHHLLAAQQQGVQDASPQVRKSVTATSAVDNSINSVDSTKTSWFGSWFQSSKQKEKMQAVLEEEDSPEVREEMQSMLEIMQTNHWTREQRLLIAKEFGVSADEATALTEAASPVAQSTSALSNSASGTAGNDGQLQLRVLVQLASSGVELCERERDLSASSCSRTATTRSSLNSTMLGNEVEGMATMEMQRLTVAMELREGHIQGWMSIGSYKLECQQRSVLTSEAELPEEEEADLLAVAVLGVRGVKLADVTTLGAMARRQQQDMALFVSVHRGPNNQNYSTSRVGQGSIKEALDAGTTIHGATDGTSKLVTTHATVEVAPLSVYIGVNLLRTFTGFVLRPILHAQRLDEEATMLPPPAVSTISRAGRAFADAENATVPSPSCYSTFDAASPAAAMDARREMANTLGITDYKASALTEKEEREASDPILRIAALAKRVERDSTVTSSGNSTVVQWTARLSKVAVYLAEEEGKQEARLTLKGLCVRNDAEMEAKRSQRVLALDAQNSKVVTAASPRVAAECRALTTSTSEMVETSEDWMNYYYMSVTEVSMDCLYTATGADALSAPNTQVKPQWWPLLYPTPLDITLKAHMMPKKQLALPRLSMTIRSAAAVSGGAVKSSPAVRLSVSRSRLSVLCSSAMLLLDFANSTRRKFELGLGSAATTASTSGAGAGAGALAIEETGCARDAKGSTWFKLSSVSVGAGFIIDDDDQDSSNAKQSESRAQVASELPRRYVEIKRGALIVYHVERPTFPEHLIELVKGGFHIVTSAATHGTEAAVAAEAVRVTLFVECGGTSHVGNKSNSSGGGRSGCLEARRFLYDTMGFPHLAENAVLMKAFVDEWIREHQHREEDVATCAKVAEAMSTIEEASHTTKCHRVVMWCWDAAEAEQLTAALEEAAAEFHAYTVTHDMLAMQQASVHPLLRTQPLLCMSLETPQCEVQLIEEADETILKETCSKLGGRMLRISGLSVDYQQYPLITTYELSVSQQLLLLDDIEGTVEAPRTLLCVGSVPSAIGTAIPTQEQPCLAVKVSLYARPGPLPSLIDASLSVPAHHPSSPLSAQPPPAVGGDGPTSKVHLNTALVQVLEMLWDLSGIVTNRAFGSTALLCVPWAGSKAEHVVCATGGGNCCLSSATAPDEQVEPSLDWARNITVAATIGGSMAVSVSYPAAPATKATEATEALATAQAAYAGKPVLVVEATQASIAWSHFARGEHVLSCTLQAPGALASSLTPSSTASQQDNLHRIASPLFGRTTTKLTTSSGHNSSDNDDTWATSSSHVSLSLTIRNRPVSTSLSDYVRQGTGSDSAASLGYRFDNALDVEVSGVQLCYRNPQLLSLLELTTRGLVSRCIGISDRVPFLYTRRAQWISGNALNNTEKGSGGSGSEHASSTPVFDWCMMKKHVILAQSVVWLPQDARTASLVFATAEGSSDLQQCLCLRGGRLEYSDALVKGSNNNNSKSNSETSTLRGLEVCSVMSISLAGSSLCATSTTSAKCTASTADASNGNSGDTPRIIVGDLSATLTMSLQLFAPHTLDERRRVSSLCVGSSTSDNGGILACGSAADFAAMMTVAHSNYMESAWKSAFVERPEAVDPLVLFSGTPQIIESWLVDCSHVCLGVHERNDADGLASNALVIDRLHVERHDEASGARRMSGQFSALRVWNLSHLAASTPDLSFKRDPSEVCDASFAFLSLTPSSSSYPLCNPQMGVAASVEFSIDGNGRIASSTDLGLMSLSVAPRFTSEASRIFLAPSLQEAVTLFLAPKGKDSTVSAAPQGATEALHTAMMEQVSLTIPVAHGTKLAPLIQFAFKDITAQAETSNSRPELEYTMSIGNLVDSRAFSSPGDASSLSFRRLFIKAPSIQQMQWQPAQQQHPVNRSSSQKQAALSQDLLEELFSFTPTAAPTTPLQPSSLKTASKPEPAASSVEPAEAQTPWLSLSRTHAQGLRCYVEPTWCIVPPSSCRAALQSFWSEYQATQKIASTGAALFDVNTGGQADAATTTTTTTVGSMARSSSVEVAVKDAAFVVVQDDVEVTNVTALTSGLLLSLGDLSYSSSISLSTQPAAGKASVGALMQRQDCFCVPAIALRTFTHRDTYLVKPFHILGDRKTSATHTSATTDGAKTMHVELDVGAVNVDVSQRHYEELLTGLVRSVLKPRLEGVSSERSLDCSGDAVLLTNTYLYRSDTAAATLGSSGSIVNPSLALPLPKWGSTTQAFKIILEGLSLRIRSGAETGGGVYLSLDGLCMRHANRRKLIRTDAELAIAIQDSVDADDVFALPVRLSDNGAEHVSTHQETTIAFPRIQLGVEGSGKLISLKPIAARASPADDDNDALSAIDFGEKEVAALRISRTNCSELIDVQLGLFTVTLDANALATFTELMYRPYAHIVLPEYLVKEVKQIDRDMMLANDLHLTRQVKMRVLSTERNHITINAAGHSIYFHDFGEPLITLDAGVTLRFINAKLYLYGNKLDHYINAGNGSYTTVDPAMNTIVPGTRKGGNAAIRARAGEIVDNLLSSESTVLQGEKEGREERLCRRIAASGNVKVVLPELAKNVLGGAAGVAAAANGNKSLVLHAAVNMRAIDTHHGKTSSQVIGREGTLAPSPPSERDSFTMTCELRDFGVQRHYRNNDYSSSGVFASLSAGHDDTDLMSKWSATVSLNQVYLYEGSSSSGASGGVPQEQRFVEVVADTGAEMQLRYSDLFLCVSALRQAINAVESASGSIQFSVLTGLWSSADDPTTTATMAVDSIAAATAAPPIVTHVSVSVKYICLYLVNDSRSVDMPLFLVRLDSLLIPNAVLGQKNSIGSTLTRWQGACSVSVNCYDLLSSAWIPVVEKVLTEGKWACQGDSTSIKAHVYNVKVNVSLIVVDNARRLVQFSELFSLASPPADNDTSSTTVSSPTTQKAASVFQGYLIRQNLGGQLTIRFAHDDKRRFPDRRSLALGEEFAFNFPRMDGHELPRSQQCFIVEAPLTSAHASAVTAISVNIAAHGKLRLPLGSGIVAAHSIVDVTASGGQKCVNIRSNITIANSLNFPISLTSGSLGVISPGSTLHIPVDQLRARVSFAPIVQFPCEDGALGICFDTLPALVGQTFLCMCDIVSGARLATATASTAATGTSSLAGRTMVRGENFDIKQGVQRGVYFLLHVTSPLAPRKNTPVDFVDCRATFAAAFSIVNKMGLPVRLTLLTRHVIEGKRLAVIELTSDTYVYEQVAAVNLASGESYGVTQVDPFQNVFIDLAFSQPNGGSIGRQDTNRRPFSPAWVYSPTNAEKRDKVLQLEDINTGMTLIVSIGYERNQIVLNCPYWFINETPLAIQIADAEQSQQPFPGQSQAQQHLIAGLGSRREDCLDPSQNGAPFLFNSDNAARKPDNTQVRVRLGARDTTVSGTPQRAGGNARGVQWSRWSPPLTISSLTKEGVVVCQWDSLHARTVSFAVELGPEEAGGARIVTFRPRWVIVNVSRHSLQLSQKPPAGSIATSTSTTLGALPPSPPLLCPTLAPKECYVVDRVVINPTAPVATSTNAIAACVRFQDDNVTGDMLACAWTKAVSISEQDEYALNVRHRQLVRIEEYWPQTGTGAEETCGSAVLPPLRPEDIVERNKELYVMREETGVVRVTTFRRSSILYVAVSHAEPPPYMIENRSEYVLHVKQEDAQHVTRILPHTSKAYAWEEPQAAPHMVLWVVDGSSDTQQPLSRSVSISFHPLDVLQRGEDYFQEMEVQDVTHRAPAQQQQQQLQLTRQIKRMLYVRVRRLNDTGYAVCIAAENTSYIQRSVPRSQLRCRVEMDSLYALISERREKDMLLVTVKPILVEYAQGVVLPAAAANTQRASAEAPPTTYNGDVQRLDIYITTVQVDDERAAAKEKVIAQLIGSSSSFLKVERHLISTTPIVYCPSVAAVMMPLELHVEDSFVYDILPFFKLLSSTWNGLSGASQGVRYAYSGKAWSHEAFSIDSDAALAALAGQWGAGGGMPGAVTATSSGGNNNNSSNNNKRGNRAASSSAAAWSARTFYVGRLYVDKVLLSVSLYRSPGAQNDPMWERFGALSLLIRSVKDARFDWPRIDQKGVCAPAWVLAGRYGAAYKQRLKDQLPSLLNVVGLDTMRGFVSDLLQGGSGVDGANGGKQKSRTGRRAEAHFAQDSSDSMLTEAQNSYISVSVVGKHVAEETAEVGAMREEQKRSMLDHPRLVRVLNYPMPMQIAQVARSQPWSTFVSMATGAEMKEFGFSAVARVVRVSATIPVHQLRAETMTAEAVKRRASQQVSAAIASITSTTGATRGGCRRCREIEEMRTDRLITGAATPLPHPRDGVLTWHEYAHHIAWEEFVEMCSADEVKLYATLVKDGIVGASKNVVRMQL